MNGYFRNNRSQLHAVDLKIKYPSIRNLRSQRGDLISNPINIHNAGLVLTSPFLPHLFQRLGMLDEDGHLRTQDKKVISRAVHLLQYLVDGSNDTPDQLLILNKIICGVPTDTLIEPAVEITEQERELCEHLLKSIIARWPEISNISITALRETFLQRDGELLLLSDNSKLKVQRKTIDALVDQLPWTISVVFHKWMRHPLSVNW